VIVVNPGSHILADCGGWTNTYAGALAEARRWLDRMRDDGLAADVELVVPDEPVERDGRWRFGFRHRVTGVTVVLETHGIDDLDAYRRQAVFEPRVYWRGSSSATPSLDDWAAPGFVQTYRAES
jgi:hypothetical protein